MKRIYYTMCTEVNHGTLEEPKIEQILSPVKMTWSEASEEIAKKEAYNGEYEIVDDGMPEPTVEPTTDDVLNILLGVTA